jgi:hypothetical protein
MLELAFVDPAYELQNPLALSNPIEPATFISFTICRDQDALAMLLPIPPTTSIDGTINIRELSVPMIDTLYHITFVHLPSWEFHLHLFQFVTYHNN